MIIGGENHRRLH